MENNNVKKVMAAYLLLMALGFLAGVVLAQIKGAELAEGCGLFSFDWVTVFLFSEIDTKAFFFYCLKRRSLAAVFLLLVTFSALSVVLNAVFCFFAGALAGVGISIGAMQMGIRGPVLFGFLGFPQGLCYLPAWFCCLLLGLRRSDARKTWVVVLAAFFLFTVGLFLESYVNPLVLHKILKNFY